MDLIETLINNRRFVANHLYSNYSYQYLIDTFKKHNSEGDDKKIYRILSGDIDSKKYIQSSIDWIPSKELIMGIISVIKHFRIQHVEEIYTGHALLADLLDREIDSINITASDTFENVSTLNKINSFPIAKRNVDDFKYFPIMNEPYPNMIISTYYPNDDNENDKSFLADIIKVFGFGHEIVMIILPSTFTQIYDMIYSLGSNIPYNIKSFHIKAIDKYFFIEDMLKSHYSTNMMMHIFVKNNFHHSKSIEEILNSAIINVPYIDTRCKFLKKIQKFYPLFPDKLINSICSNYDLSKPFALNGNFIQINNCFSTLEKLNIKYTPNYIHVYHEYVFWAKCVLNNLYFLFIDRKQFFTFYILVIVSRDNLSSFPSWIKNLKILYICIYMRLIGNNYRSKRDLLHYFNRINRQNKKTILNK